MSLPILPSCPGPQPVPLAPHPDYILSVNPSLHLCPRLCSATVLSSSPAAVLLLTLLVLSPPNSFSYTSCHHLLKTNQCVPLLLKTLQRLPRRLRRRSRFAIQDQIRSDPTPTLGTTPRPLCPSPTVQRHCPLRSCPSTGLSPCFITSLAASVPEVSAQMPPPQRVSWSPA